MSQAWLGDKKMKEDGKTFYNVIKMSEGFRDFERDNKVQLATGLETQCRAWELRFQLAIAQQLTMIAQHLGEIVAQSKSKD